MTPFSTESPSSDHIELLSHGDSRLCHDPNRRRLDGTHPTTELNSTTFSPGATHTTEESHFICDVQHNTHRPIVTLKQVLPTTQWPKPQATVLQSKLPQSSFPFSSYISRCDIVPSISYPDLFHCLHLKLVQVLTGQFVRLRLYRAQRNHVSFGTLDIDDTSTNSHCYAVEALLIFSVFFFRRKEGTVSTAKT